MREEEMKLKRGDRVRAVGHISDMDMSGKIGTVIDINLSLHLQFLVEFDEPFEGGHSGGGKGKEGRCWWCDERHLESPNEWDGLFQAVLAERKRMCNSYSLCKECPHYNLGKQCEIVALKNPALVEKIVKEWSLAHPKEPPKHVKTRTEDFFEKFPNAPIDVDGVPEVCVMDCGYRKDCPHVKYGDCVDCWNEPLTEDEQDV